MKNFTYNDVLTMPTYERRFYLSLHTKQRVEQEEQIEELKENAKTSGGKGNRTTRVSGSALKNRFNNGDMPLQ
jgi:hypothetical protein